ncbi:hypothetical protein BDY21DRAFT_278099 [Lineolata rhizophorae]|uniref:Uncharacterized protein n=1 Tax=Lineolata rhizophorae TaxID=578093 RepID=A0A6A6PBK5_9PEZI|nr:hypothetical protein BDY21DRAFT_278099 [Lineolata rhizophorae]
MTESPFMRAPLEPREQPILDKLLQARAALELLKQDKSTYVKSSDVLRLYNAVVDQVVVLNEIRSTGNKRLEQNRVDTVLDDCFQLISLAFLTIGKNHEAPAVYAALSTIKRLLDHLKEAAFFSSKDLDSISSRLQDFRKYIDRGREGYSPHLITLLENRIDMCQATLTELQDALAPLGPELSPHYEKLVSILRSLSACNTKSKFPTQEVNDLHAQLKEVEASLGPIVENQQPLSEKELLDLYYKKYQDMQIEPGSHQTGKIIVNNLMIRCFLWVDIIKKKRGRIDERFQDTFDKLNHIKMQLERLSLTHAWSLRETDLYSYQRQLDRIDESRVDGNFLDDQGQPADLHAQRTLLYLLRKSYALIYHLIISSEPVSEALVPIYNQLLTLRRCLLEVRKSGGVSSPRELYPYSMKLNSIDNMRNDGKFMVGEDIPDGQAAVTQLLEECFDMAYELRSAAEEEEEREEREDAAVAEAERKADEESGERVRVEPGAEPGKNGLKAAAAGGSESEDEDEGLDEGVEIKAKERSGSGGGQEKGAVMRDGDVGGF